VAAAVLGTGGAIAMASIPAAGGTIDACFKNNNGDLRVVDDARSCKNNETAIEWNQSGPQAGRRQRRRLRQLQPDRRLLRSDRARERSPVRHPCGPGPFSPYPECQFS
jgi:hypothetical protein